MNIGQLSEALAGYPPDAEILVAEDGDPSVGIFGACFALSGRISDDRHAFIADDHPTPYADGSGEVLCCSICGIIEEAHASAPVVVWLEGER